MGRMTKEQKKRLGNNYDHLIETITFGIYNRQLAIFDKLKESIGKDFNRSETIRRALDLYFNTFLVLFNEYENNLNTFERIDSDKFVIIDGKIRQLLGVA